MKDLSELENDFVVSFDGFHKKGSDNMPRAAPPALGNFLSYLPSSEIYLDVYSSYSFHSDSEHIIISFVK